MTKVNDSEKRISKCAEELPGVMLVETRVEWYGQSRERESNSRNQRDNEKCDEVKDKLIPALIVFEVDMRNLVFYKSTGLKMSTREVLTGSNIRSNEIALDLETWWKCITQEWERIVWVPDH